MRTYAVPLMAVVAIAVLTGVTVFRDLGLDGAEEPEEAYGFPSDLEKQEAPVVRRNGASGPAPRFKQARDPVAEQAAASDPAAGRIPDPFDEAEAADRPPEWLRAVFDTLAALGLLGGDAPRPGSLETMDRTGFDTADGQVSPEHDFSTPDVRAPGYEARAPEYPTASGELSRRPPRTIPRAPRGLSE